MSSSEAKPRGPLGFLRLVAALLVKGVVPIVVLLLAALGAQRMIETAPTAPRQQATRQPKLVEVDAIRVESRTVVLEAMGGVQPARQVELKPQVAGRVEWLADNLVPGGRFAEGEPLIRIERRDYELAVDQRKGDIRVAEAAVVEAQRRLTQAEQDLRLEMGNQAVARRDFEVLEEEITEDNHDLVLRRPQLEAARAAVEAAKAAVASAEAAREAARSRLENAQLDLNRTVIAAPFNVVVDSKFIDLGDTVSANTEMVRLIGSDEFWIELALASSDLQWVQVPETLEGTGSEVRIVDRASWPEGVYRTGRVIRRLPSVTERGRMARLLVAVRDPLALGAEGSPPLLVGDYVTAEIAGRQLDGVVALPRRLLRGGDQVWLMDKSDALEFRRVVVAYRAQDEVLIRGGLEPGDRIVLTELSAPVEGTPLRLHEESRSGAPERTADTGGGRTIP